MKPFYKGLIAVILIGFVFIYTREKEVEVPKDIVVDKVSYYYDDILFYIEVEGEFYKGQEFYINYDIYLNTAALFASQKDRMIVTKNTNKLINKFPMVLVYIGGLDLSDLRFHSSYFDVIDRTIGLGNPCLATTLLMIKVEDQSGELLFPQQNISLRTRYSQKLSTCSMRKIRVR